MTKDEAPTSPKDAALTLARDWIAERPADRPVSAGKMISIIDRALAQPEQDDRRLQIAMRQWEDWKVYALELQKKLVKYEGGSPMILNTQPVQESVTTYTCSVCGVSMQMERQWVGLTPTEIELIVCYPWGETANWVRAIEKALKEKNT